VRVARPRFNHRTISGILDMMRMVGAIVGADAKATALVEQHGSAAGGSARTFHDVGRHPNSSLKSGTIP